MQSCKVEMLQTAQMGFIQGEVRGGRGRVRVRVRNRIRGNIMVMISVRIWVRIRVRVNVSARVRLGLAMTLFQIVALTLWTSCCRLPRLAPSILELLLNVKHHNSILNSTPCALLVTNSV